MSNTKQITWKREDGQYIASNGARVYCYGRKAFQGAEWGVQLPTWSQGDGGFRTMAEAKAYVERHA